MKSGKTSDKLLSKLRDLCLAFPEAKEVEAWGHPTFRAARSCSPRSATTAKARRSG